MEDLEVRLRNVKTKTRRKILDEVYRQAIGEEKGEYSEYMANKISGNSDDITDLRGRLHDIADLFVNTNAQTRRIKKDMLKKYSDFMGIAHKLEETWTEKRIDEVFTWEEHIVENEDLSENERRELIDDVDRLQYMAIHNMGALGQAPPRLLKALEYNPSNASTHFMLMESFFNLGDYKSVVQHGTNVENDVRLQFTDRSTSIMSYMFGLSLFRTGDNVKARKMLDMSWKLTGKWLNAFQYFRGEKFRKELCEYKSKKIIGKEHKFHYVGDRPFGPYNIKFF